MELEQVCILRTDKIRWNNPLLLMPYCYEVIAMVAPTGHYDCTIVMS